MKKETNKSSIDRFDLSGSIFALASAIRDDLNAIPKGVDQEKVHALRVQIKKLRAAIHLQISCSGNKPKEYRYFAKTFSRAGKARTAYLHMVLMEPFAKDEKELALWQEEADLLLKKFQAHAAAYLLEAEQLLSKLKQAKQSFSDKKIKKYFNALAGEIEKKLLHTKGKKTYHHLRKRIKLLLHNYDLLPESRQKKIGLDIKYLDMLQQKTGDWHDAYMALCFFREEKQLSKDQIAEIAKKEKILFHAMRKAFKPFGEKVYLS